MISNSCSCLISFIPTSCVWDIPLKKNNSSSFYFKKYFLFFIYIIFTGYVMIWSRFPLMREYFSRIWNNFYTSIFFISIMNCCPESGTVLRILRLKINIILMPCCTQTMFSRFPKSLTQITIHIFSFFIAK